MTGLIYFTNPGAEPNLAILYIDRLDRARKSVLAETAMSLSAILIRADSQYKSSRGEHYLEPRQSISEFRVLSHRKEQRPRIRSSLEE